MKDNALTVKLKKLGVAQADGISVFNGTWKWVMFIEIDKTNLKDNMKVFIKRS